MRIADGDERAVRWQPAEQPFDMGAGVGSVMLWHLSRKKSTTRAILSPEAIAHDER